MIVVDTNVMVYLLAGEGPRADRAADLLLRDPEWAAPPILLGELRNVLAGSVRRGLVALPDALSMQDDAALILGDRTAGVDGAAVLRAALDLGLSAYDAEFVVLARTLGVALITEDREVLLAAGDVAVRLSDD
ncbi:MAG: PIN domain-containing protein [Gemmatimonadetes bacterium]|nr:PIN domain-containing protein [Gemmatimonadota bacterium]